MRRSLAWPMALCVVGIAVLAVYPLYMYSEDLALRTVALCFVIASTGVLCTYLNGYRDRAADLVGIGAYLVLVAGPVALVAECFWGNACWLALGIGLVGLVLACYGWSLRRK